MHGTGRRLPAGRALAPGLARGAPAGTAPRPDPDQRLLRGARRRLTAQVAGAISVLLGLLGTMVCGVMFAEQDRSALRELSAATQRGSVTHPPPCVWLFELSGHTLRGSPGAPWELPVGYALRAVAAGAPPRVERVEVAGVSYLVRSERRGLAAYQAVLDLRYQAAERARLVGTLLAAELAGLLAAVLLGQVIARRAIEPLGAALARQRRFAADVSHELRTPLTRLHTRAQLVARRARQDGGRVAEDLDRIVTGTRQLGEVVEDLLISAHLGRPSGPYGEVDLAALAEEAADAESARAQARGVAVEVTLGGTGPVPPVHGARTALRRVITALLDNALRHTGPGGHVRITVSAVPGAVLLAVSDDGAGLDPRDAERLFTRFTTGRQGFGLGLALVREVVDGHGGTITADGSPGQGAVFTVRLPALT
ncbi:sensor histidine kinase [Nonomuraea sp. NPDC048826]|uniref:sensor histidine kinase n=1 Tax=Nonomuraea sp. NPDC048826 TaxID=3364347 RepID=UPI0037185655